MPDATTRDLVGDWLYGPMQHVPKTYTLADAEAAYQCMKKDIFEIGPMTQKSEGGHLLLQAASLASSQATCSISLS